MPLYRSAIEIATPKAMGRTTPSWVIASSLKVVKPVERAPASVASIVGLLSPRELG